MKDKFFWIALIFAGFYLFNKMKSSNTNSDVNSQTEREVDRSPTNRQETREIEPNFGDQDKPLNLPNKNGQVQPQPQNQNQNSDLPINRTNNTNEKDISLGDYGSVRLPKKNGQASSSSTSQPQVNTSTSQEIRVDLNPSTTAGSGTFRDDRGAHRLVREGEVVQIVSSSTVTVYMVSGGFCTLTNSSNNTLYVEANSQLMLTGDGSNNTVYYEGGAEIRNGLEDNRNNRFIEVSDIVFN